MSHSGWPARWFGTGVLALIGALATDAAQAQLDQAIPADALTAPWVAARAVVLSLPQAISQVNDSAKRADIEQGLAELEIGLGELRTQQENVAISIASNPAFAYNASLSAQEMAERVRAIDVTFAQLLSGLALEQRSDVQAARNSILGMQRILAEPTAFEREVLGAIASGGKNQIQSLAAKWWAASESVNGAAEAVAQVRHQP